MCSCFFFVYGVGVTLIGGTIILVLNSNKIQIKDYIDVLHIRFINLLIYHLNNPISDYLTNFQLLIFLHAIKTYYRLINIKNSRH